MTFSTDSDILLSAIIQEHRLLAERDELEQAMPSDFEVTP
jgi:hypothetical protein